MRNKLKIYKFIILSVFVMTSMSITGWASAVNSEKLAEIAKSQKELKNNGQVSDRKQLAGVQTNIILVLVCAGLIGFLGVRRQNKTSKNVVKVTHSECSSHANSMNENDPVWQACRAKLNIPDTCFLNEPCSA